MAFECPSCRQGALNIAFSLELPPADYDDEITLQTVKCAGCGFSGMAVYRESRRGSLSSESWHHDGYEVTEDSMVSLLEQLVLCPLPGDKRCVCAAHQGLGKLNWINPAQNGLQVVKAFKMNLVK